MTVGFRLKARTQSDTARFNSVRVNLLISSWFMQRLLFVARICTIYLQIVSLILTAFFFARTCAAKRTSVSDLVFSARISAAWSPFPHWVAALHGVARTCAILYATYHITLEWDT